MARNRNRAGTLQSSVISDGEGGSAFIRLANLLDRGNDLVEALRLTDASIQALPRYRVISVTTDTTLVIDDQVVLATGGVTINLALVLNGMSVFVKNIDTSGVVTINPGANKIDQGAGAASTSDITIASMVAVELIFFTDTWWIV